MDYDKLTSEYWEQQLKRVQAVLSKIKAQPSSTSLGRVIPDPDDLAIGTGRTLNAAVMFTDISGFSKRRSGMQDQQTLLLNVLNLYFSEMIRIAEEYGGTVEKNTGDGLMAYFEDGPEDGIGSGSKRAVAAALTMMYVNENALKTVFEQSGVDPIEFRIGIDYGLVTIAQLGAARRFGGLVAIGATANIACKMLANCSPGDIVIGADVYGQIPTTWRTYAVIHNTDSGWVRGPLQSPYWFYKYTGRWTRPL